MVVPVQCTVNLPSYRDVSVKIGGSLRTDALHAVCSNLMEMKKYNVGRT